MANWSRNRGARGGPAPQYINKGGPGPPNVGFFPTFQPLLQQIFFGSCRHKLRLQKLLLYFIHFKNRHVHTYDCIYVGPPNIKYLPTPLYQTSCVPWFYLPPRNYNSATDRSHSLLQWSPSTLHSGHHLEMKFCPL